MRTRLLLALLFALPACSRVSTSEARDFEKGLRAAVEAPPDMRARLLYQSCAEIKSCASGCDRELALAAQESTDEAQRATLFASCFSEYRGHRGEPPAQWFVGGHLARYAQRARRALDESERPDFDTLCAKTGVPVSSAP